MAAWYIPQKNLYLLTFAITLLMLVLRFDGLQTHVTLLPGQGAHYIAAE